MMFKLAEIQTFVSDLGRARTFYERRLGFVVKRLTETYVIYDVGSTSLVISAGAKAVAPSGDYGTRPSTVPVFLCPDIEEAVQRLKTEDVTIVRDIQELPEGRLAVIADPDGNLIELIG